MALNINLKKLNLDALIKLPLSKKLMILGAVNLVILGAVVWFLVRPKYEEVRKLRIELAELNTKLRENRAIAADIPKFLREKQEMEDKLAAAVAQLPNDKEIPNLIDSISSSAELSGLKIALFKPGKENPKGFYAEIPVQMTVEGRFESLYDFSVKISNLPRIVNLSGMDVTSTGYKNRVPVLNANFTATTFRFIPTPAESGAKTPSGEPNK